MIHALATGAGKDATLALHRARKRGLEVAFGFNVLDGESGRVPFHGTRATMVERHVRALEMEPLLARTGPEGFEPALRDLLKELVARGVGGVVFGNVHLEGVRAWYEERVDEAGMVHVEPLWGDEPAELVRDAVELGYRATVVSVDLERGDPAWLGRRLDPELVAEIEAVGADPCGEHGEYHTFVSDGPRFRHPVPFGRGRVVEMEGHRLLDLVPGDAGDPVAGGSPNAEGF